MKNCHKWMIACVVGAAALIFVLPKLGVSIWGASLLFPLLMIGCCVLPMFFMMRASSDGKGGSCCSKESKSKQKTEGEVDKEKSGSGGCH
ncbi:MAG TPA: hypothetical protein PKA63_12720 [Oligoflexia bacterium]|nr:hypothetical protein [Oligoflexia bacterium]HMP49521.1 hypothetical protein [Oligoflexia bacterium]